MNTTIAPTSAWFEGHFPDRPILPGVAQVALILDALAHARRSPVALRAIRFVRLRQAVFPGERLELSARDLSDGHLRVELKRNAVVVMNGELVVDAARGERPVGAHAANEALSMASAPDLDALLPHRLPMRFVTAILAERADGLDCTAAIPERCALMREGSAPALAALEAAAQTAAAWEAVRRARASGDTTPRVGYVVGLRDVSMHAERIAADARFRTSVRLQDIALPLTHYWVEASLAGARIATGTIATYLMPQR